MLNELFQLDQGGQGNHGKNYQGMFGQGGFGQGQNGTCDGTCQNVPTPTVDGTDG
ncbi:MAG TPA: hypothetical protein VLR89_00230 [Anaerolineaceae bacterium]|nr:hypothetical protein [Anaerolineaceae bacterium]